jgi:hypothetical protein
MHYSKLRPSLSIWILVSKLCGLFFASRIVNEMRKEIVNVA